MTPEQLASANEILLHKTPAEIIRWAIEAGQGRTIVSTNFRPYEAVILHLCTQVQADIPVLWVDHGYNRPATYRHMQTVKQRLDLNLKAYVPQQTAACRDALQGPVPTPDDEKALQEFSAVFKLEPFQRGIRELDVKVWITSLRKVQNPNRETMDMVSMDENFGTIRVCPVFHLSDQDMEAYLAQHELPNEWDYFDPAKADEKRECGLHVPGHS